MRRLTLVAIWISTFLLAGAAFGDSVTLQITGVGGQSLGGFYVAPYMGHLSTDGGATYGSTFDIICDDFTHDISLGDSWAVNITPLASGSLGNTRFANADGGSSIYSQLVWLGNQMNFQSSPNNNADLQWAMWYLTDATYSNGNLVTPNLSLAGLSSMDQNNILSLVAQAQAHASGVDLSGWEAITPVAGADSPSGGFGQEYLAAAPVPEPSTLVLLGSGILGFFVRRVRK